MTVREKSAEKTEYLVGFYRGGEVHACFYTALRTLCLRELNVLPESDEGWSELAPTCRVCSALVIEWATLHEIDPMFTSGVPRDWLEEM